MIGVGSLMLPCGSASAAPAASSVVHMPSANRDFLAKCIAHPPYTHRAAFHGGMEDELRQDRCGLARCEAREGGSRGVDDKGGLVVKLLIREGTLKTRDRKP